MKSVLTPFALAIAFLLVSCGTTPESTMARQRETQLPKRAAARQPIPPPTPKPEVISLTEGLKRAGEVRVSVIYVVGFHNKDFKLDLLRWLTAKLQSSGYKVTDSADAQDLVVSYAANRFVVGTPRKVETVVGGQTITRVDTPDLHSVEKYRLELNLRGDALVAHELLLGEVEMPGLTDPQWTDVEPYLEKQLVPILSRKASGAEN